MACNEPGGFVAQVKEVFSKIGDILAAAVSMESVRSMTTVTGDAGTEVAYDGETNILTVPKGDTGAQGVPGADGADGAQGVPGADGVGDFIDSSIAMSSDDSALGSVTDGTGGAIAVGENALASATTPSNNIAIGPHTLRSLNGNSQNVAIGYEAASFVEGYSNTALGTFALKGISVASIGNLNVGIGVSAGTTIKGGDKNTLIGSYAASNLTTGNMNTHVGYNSGSQSSGGGDGTGDNNTTLGYMSGTTLTTGYGNVFIGNRAGSTTDYRTVNNKLIIANNQNDNLIEGDFLEKTLDLDATVTVNKALIGLISTVAYGATVNIDMPLSNRFRCALNGNITVGLPTNIVEGQGGFIYLEQDATGGRVASWNAIFDFDEAPTVDTAANKINVYAYEVYSSSIIFIRHVRDI